MSAWDKLAICSPRDRVAGVVTSRSAGMVPVGPRVASTYPRWSVAPATKPAAKDQPDLTGRVAGALTVVGYLGKSNPKRAGKWLVRCRCGYFEARTAKALTASTSNTDGCCECRYVEALKSSDRARSARFAR